LVFEDLHVEVVTVPDSEAKGFRAHFDWRVKNLIARHGTIVARKLLARVV